MSSAIDNVIAMEQGLRDRFSQFRPSIFPKPYQHFKDVRELVSSSDDRAAALGVLKQAAAKAKKDLGVDEVAAVVETRLNFRALRLEVVGIRFVVPEDAAAFNLEHFLRVNDEDVSQAKVLAQRVISANALQTKQSASDTAPAGLSPLALVHECYNTSYTLKVLASNMKLKAAAIVGSDSEKVPLPLEPGTNVASVIKTLCEQGDRR